MTQAYLYDADICQKIDSFADELLAFTTEDGCRLSEQTDIGLLVEYEVQEEPPLCYYFVHHKKRLLFWLKGLGIEYLMDGLDGVPFISFAHCSMFFQLDSKPSPSR